MRILIEDLWSWSFLHLSLFYVKRLKGVWVFDRELLESFIIKWNSGVLSFLKLGLLSHQPSYINHCVLYKKYIYKRQQQINNFLYLYMHCILQLSLILHRTILIYHKIVTCPNPRHNKTRHFASCFDISTFSLDLIITIQAILIFQDPNN